MFLVDQSFDAHCHNAFLAIAAVVCHDECLIRTLTHFVFEDDQILAAPGQHREHSVAGSFQGSDDRQHRRHAHATTGTNHRTEILDMCGITQWAHHVGHIVAHIQIA